MSNIHSRVEVLFQHILQHGSIFQRIILLIHHNCVEINIKLPKTKLVGVMFLSLKAHMRLYWSRSSSQTASVHKCAMQATCAWDRPVPRSDALLAGPLLQTVVQCYEINVPA